MTVVKIERKKQHHYSKKNYIHRKSKKNLRQPIVLNVSKVAGYTQNTKISGIPVHLLQKSWML